nr:hypothetical protein [Muribaculaceae bacterium]
MRRIKTITLSLLTLILGVTAWAQVSQRAARAPKAVGDLQIINTVPAQGTVTELSRVTVNWTSDIAYVDENSYIVGEVVNAEGTKVAELDSEGGQAWNQTILV